ncbi:hypothetical protein L1987_01863 [Smallanthus sonchifolius]|uniref:Uncharacterized protein n=1 Tax=Smallanthus sonchifolius TaxID=185202 RepID=A0ACB9K6G6_9ASTR|nr:hypothetical protein L1987_01863 [Smallanthus sonchifolius]
MGGVLPADKSEARKIQYRALNYAVEENQLYPKVMRTGYYWPGMYKALVDEIHKCDNCQRHAPVSRRPCMNLVSVTSAWPFCKWAINIVGPFPEAVGRVKFLIVAIDYFTKWIEAKPLATITGQQV